MLDGVRFRVNPTPVCIVCVDRVTVYAPVRSSRQRGYPLNINFLWRNFSAMRFRDQIEAGIDLAAECLFILGRNTGYLFVSIDPSK